MIWNSLFRRLGGQLRRPGAYWRKNCAQGRRCYLRCMILPRLNSLKWSVLPLSVGFGSFLCNRRKDTTKFWKLAIFSKKSVLSIVWCSKCTIPNSLLKSDLHVFLRAGCSVWARFFRQKLRVLPLVIVIVIVIGFCTAVCRCYILSLQIVIDFWMMKIIITNFIYQLCKIIVLWSSQ